MISSFFLHSLKNVKIFLIRFIATFGFSGYVPFASGTFGSLVATLIIYPIVDQTTVAEKGYMIYTAFLFGYTATDLYIKKTKRKDPKEVVIDEAIGIAITIALSQHTLETLLPEVKATAIFISTFSFLLFRVFDIFKPFPINYIDKKLKGTLGVIFDDVVAAIFASLTFWGFVHYIVKIK